MENIFDGNLSPIFIVNLLIIFFSASSNTLLYLLYLIVNALTGIMADDYEIEDNKKALDDVINNYQKEKLMARRNEIIQSLNNANLDKEKANELEKELHTLIIKLAQIK